MTEAMKENGEHSVIVTNRDDGQTMKIRTKL